MLKFFSKNFYIYLFFVFFIFISDRLSKIYIINESSKNLDNFILKSTYLNIRLIWNEGIAFGLLSFDDKLFYHSLSILILIIIFIIIYMIIKSNGSKKFSLILILGGALGNFYDRIAYGAVPDFIDFHLNGFHWFIFNIADIFISIGVFALIVLEIFDKKNYEKN
ncbi:signal peptidase II [Candidatus Pelagibacter sp.]|uniref:signal peptidase II n=1 Tax=Candidatus Pelagibacter sp. TaxID=2024849 RepID=UPI003F875871